MLEVARPPTEVEDHLRCKRHGCRAAWPDDDPEDQCEPETLDDAAWSDPGRRPALSAVQVRRLRSRTTTAPASAAAAHGTGASAIGT